MAEYGARNKFLPLPAVAELRHNADHSKISLLRGQMERTTSADIRQEGKELQEAAEQTLNVILDLTLDGKIRWASPTWNQVVGIPFDTVKGKPVADVLVGDNQVFDDAVASMRKDDSGSKFLRFSVGLRADMSLKIPMIPEETEDGCEAFEDDSRILHLEAQGIMVYDRSTGEESHVRAGAIQ